MQQRLKDRNNVDVRIPGEKVVYFHNFYLRTAIMHYTTCSHYTSRPRYPGNVKSKWSKEYDDYDDAYRHAKKRVPRKNIHNCKYCGWGMPGGL